MKKFLIVISAIILIAIIALISLYAYYGGFKTLEFKVEETGGELFVYEEVMGDYSQSPVYMDSVYYFLLNKLNIPTTKGAGLYFDNPQHVESSKLRSELGCILDSPIDSLQRVEISKVFKIKELSKGNYITTSFPNKGTMSTIVGIMKVYPAMTKYVEKNNYINDEPAMEIYDVPSEVIIYRKRIDTR